MRPRTEAEGGRRRRPPPPRHEGEGELQPAGQEQVDKVGGVSKSGQDPLIIVDLSSVKSIPIPIPRCERPSSMKIDP